MPGGKTKKKTSRTQSVSHVMPMSSHRPSEPILRAPSMASILPSPNLQSTPRSLAEELDKSELELTPMKGEFLNYIVDTTYVLSFTVRNRSNTTQMLRFTPPQKVPNFRLVDYQAVRLAPGLARVMDVEFSTHVEKDFSDNWTILTERGHRVSVPLIALSVPALEMDALIDFGMVEQRRTEISKTLNLKNKGRRDALVTLTVPPDAVEILAVTPSSLLAKAMAETQVKVKILKPPPIGKCRWMISVVIEGESSMRNVAVVADVIDCRSHLIDLHTGMEAASVQFKKVYAGTKQERQLMMVNGSEVRVSFAFQLSNELVAKEAPPFRFNPEQGTLGPKEKRKVTVVFEPPMNPVRKGWSNEGYPTSTGEFLDRSAANIRTREIKKFEGLFSLVFVETEETHNFYLVGESSETHAVISRTVLDFGVCAINDYRHEVIDIRNEVVELPLTFSFDRVAQFKVEPSSGVIPPGGREVVTIMFHPHGPGRCQKQFKLMLNGTVTRSIAVSGKGVVDVNFKPRKWVGGINVLPEDFRLPFQPPDFRVAAKQLTGRGYLLREEDEAEEEEGTAVKSSGYGQDKALGGAAEYPPTAADIGMIPGEGLRPPQPSHRIPQKELRAEDAANRAPSAHVGPMTFDVKSLIRRQFNEMPANAVERRDCRRELLPMDLIKIVAPIKTLQFERITIGTIAVRPFYLFNGTNASILVKMPPDELYPEMSFSPHSQVIPQGRMAAFDVSLCSHKVQTCQQVINFTINHQYPMRMFLHADVVPVEVTLSYDAVTLSFSEFTDAPITISSITLSNHGSFEATYWWKLPPHTPFTIEPEEGKIPPMSKEVAHITFAPLQGVFTSTCDAFLVVDGAAEEKKLQLTGVVEQTHCIWTKMLVKATGEAQVDLRRIPAGKTSSVSIYIANVGHRNAFFSFDSFPDWLTINPSCGRVSAGETEDLLLSVKSDKAENLSQVIFCHVRGMKRPLKMNLTANVVAPPITVYRGPSSQRNGALSTGGGYRVGSSSVRHMTSPGGGSGPRSSSSSSLPSLAGVADGKPGEFLLRFGEVFYRHEKRLSVHFRNTGDVAAVVLVDLRDCHPEAYLRWRNAKLYPDSGVWTNDQEWETFIGGSAASIPFMESAVEEGCVGIVGRNQSSLSSPGQSTDKEDNFDQHPPQIPTPLDSHIRSVTGARPVASRNSGETREVTSGSPASVLSMNNSTNVNAAGGGREEVLCPRANRRLIKTGIIDPCGPQDRLTGVYYITIEPSKEEVVYFCYCPVENYAKAKGVAAHHQGGYASSVARTSRGLASGSGTMTASSEMVGSHNNNSSYPTHVPGTTSGRRQRRLNAAGNTTNNSPSPTVRLLDASPAGSPSHTHVMCSSPRLSSSRTEEKRRYRVAWKQVGADEVLHPLPPLILEAEAIPPMIEVSHMLLRFPTTVAGTMTATKPQTLELQNLCRETFRWGIQGGPDSSTQANEQFIISPSSGTIPPMETITITVNFLGSEEGRYCGVFQVYVEQATQKPCASFAVLGIATRARLVVEKPFLIFPAVPLGITVRDVVHIFNDGFDSIQLEYRGESGPLVQVHFPKGQLLTSKTRRLPVEILFSSVKPVTLLSSILVSSNKEESVEIHLCATALNSLLTTAPFLQFREAYATIAPASILGTVSGSESLLPSRVITSRKSTSDGPCKIVPSGVKNNYTNLVSGKDFSPFMFFDKKGNAGITILGPSTYYNAAVDGTDMNRLFSGGGSRRRGFPFPLGVGHTFGGISSGGRGGGMMMMMGDRSLEMAPFEMVDAVFRTMVNLRVTVEMLTRWFNNLLLRTPVDNIVEAMAQSHGSILSDCISRLCGRRPTAAAKPTSRQASSSVVLLSASRRLSLAGEGNTRKGKARKGSVTFSPEEEGGGGGMRKERVEKSGGTITPMENPEEVLTRRTSSRTPERISLKGGTQGERLSVNGVGGRGERSSISVHSRQQRFDPVTSFSTASGSSQTAVAVFSDNAEHVRRLKGELMLQGILEFLSASGCCLHHVPAKYLLPYEEYVQTNADTSKGLSREVFNERMYQSWFSVLTEAIRVFYFSKLSFQQFTQVWKPIADENHNPLMDVNDSAWMKLKRAVQESNVYSVAESLLLFWVRSCVEFFSILPGSPFATAQKIRVSCFSDLRDPRVLIAVVLVYCPALQPVFFTGEKTLVLNPTSPAEHETNACLLFHALTELAIPQLPSPRMFLEFSQLSFALFASILMAYLPKFLSNEAVIFEGKLLSPISRVVQVRNASQKARLYRVWMENPAFQPNQKELLVPAQGTAELEIVFLPRYNRVVKGRCLLVDQSSVTLGEHVPLAFSLNAAPNMEPTKIIELSTPLYEPLSKDILVENPFQHDCVVSVRVQQGSMSDVINGHSASNVLPTAEVRGGTYSSPSGGLPQESVRPSSRLSSGNPEGDERSHNTPLPPLSSDPKAPADHSTVGGGARPHASSGDVIAVTNPSSLSMTMGRDGGKRPMGMSTSSQVGDDKLPPSAPEGSFLPSVLKNNPFFIYTDVLPLRKGDVAKLPMHFLPLARGVYSVKITFRDEREGEFSYEIRGTCEDPKPSESIDCRAEVGEPCTMGITVRSTNTALEKIIRLIEEKSRQLHLEMPPISVDWRNNCYTLEFLNENFLGPNPFFTTVEPETAEAEEARKKKSPDRVKSMRAGSVSGSGRDRHKHASGPHGNIGAVGESGYHKDGGTASSSNIIRMENATSVTFPFKFTPKMAGRYPALIRLTSPVDVRVIRLTGECVVRGQQRILQFHCPARQCIAQNITITNRSEDEWLMSGSIEGEFFSGTKELRVPAGKTKEYEIRYSPPWITDEKKKDMGLLLLRNSGTGQTHKYTLIGEADAPLSEDHIVVDCRAREQQAVMLTVPNVTKHDCTYYVETDLPFTEGESTVVVSRDSFAKYTLNFLPAVGGTYVGQIVFRSHQGPYVWFRITLVVSPPEKEGTIEIKTNVRTSVEVDVTLRNPVHKPMNFFVRRFGSGLYGENYLEVEGRSTGIYTCIFVPTRAGEMEGRLSFCNDEVGEFWYDVHIYVKDSSPENLTFTTALGEASTAVVKLTNTSEQECALQTSNTNPTNFSFAPSILIIPPMKDLLVNITYKPSCVGEVQRGELSFTHHKAGQWKYSAEGTGLLPVPSPPVKCVCPIGSSTALTLSFVNSLDVETLLLYSFSCPSTTTTTTNSAAAAAAGASSSSDGYFSIKRAPDVPVAPGATVTIVLLYSPRVVGQHHAVLEVRPHVAKLHKKYHVCWSFPIEGNAEWRETTTPFRFKCAARKNHEEVIILPAPGVTLEDKKDATIHFEPDPNQHYLSAVNASFACNLEEEGGNEAALPDAFRVRVHFTPLRSMVSSGDLLVHSASGGSWRYRVYLEASPAPVDDVIQMRAPYKSSTTVVFDLFNVFSYKSKFAAFFTNDSSKDFEVSPTHGVLLPFIPNQKNPSSATPIRLHFKPSTRVPQVEGTLVIDTEDMQWSFRVVGRLDREKGVVKKD